MLHLTKIKSSSKVVFFMLLIVSGFVGESLSFNESKSPNSFISFLLSHII